MPHSQWLSNNSYFGYMNRIPHIDIYFYKIHSNIFVNGSGTLKYISNADL